jgi:Na+-translocating ferredoxin:NAD+ oxidoreductase RnfA subunit
MIRSLPRWRAYLRIQPAALRWLGVWLVLAATYAAGWLGARLLAGNAGPTRREALVHFVAVPLVQAVALAVVAVVRRHSKR